MENFQKYDQKFESFRPFAQEMIERHEDREDRQATCSTLRGFLTIGRREMSENTEKIFQQCDANQDGYLDRGEIQNNIEEGPGREAMINHLFTKMDNKGDDRISQEEMTNYFNGLFDQLEAIIDELEAGMIAEEEEEVEEQPHGDVEEEKK